MIIRMNEGKGEERVGKRRLLEKRNGINCLRSPNNYCHDSYVRKLDLVHLCFSLNFYFLMFPLQFPSMFPLLTYSQSLILLSADYLRHSRQRRSQILIHIITGTV